MRALLGSLEFGRLSDALRAWGLAEQPAPVDA
jgi:hypothetical protein